jgi:predicted phage terminase large subunit-like protein
LQNDGHISSAWQRRTSREWFQGTLLKAGNKRTNIVNLATALHRDALAMELHRTPGWTSRVFKAIEHWPKHTVLWRAWEQIYANMEDSERLEKSRAFYEQHREAMHEGAKLLWSEEEDLYTLMKMRVEGGRVAFDREKQGSPFDPTLCEWPEDYFDEPFWFDEWPPRQVLTIALDPSKGQNERRGDYSAYVIACVGPGDVIYVDADLARRTTPQMVADGVELIRQHRPDVFGVEANQYQELLADLFQAELARQKLSMVVPLKMTQTMNKGVRIRKLSPLLAQKRLRFKANSPGAKLLVEQLQQFPLGDHDDGPDALEMAVQLAGDLMGGR